MADGPPFMPLKHHMDVRDASQPCTLRMYVSIPEGLLSVNMFNFRKNLGIVIK